MVSSKYKLAATLIMIVAGGAARGEEFVYYTPSRAQQTSAPRRPSTPAAEHAWIDSLDAAFLHAQQFRQPMLVFVANDALPESRQTWAALSSVETGKALHPWTKVRLDAETDRAIARSLGITTAPTLLALTSDGRPIAMLDHALTETGLTAWLNTQ